MQTFVDVTPPVADCQMVLATDLDGTFLGGTIADRRTLYHWLHGQFPAVRLVFVTGRDPDFIMKLCENGDVPAPDYVIGDVGTTIARFEEGRMHPIAGLEAPIVRRWHGMNDLVRTRLAGVRGLWLQPTAFRHRLSYQYDDRFDPAALQVLNGVEVDILISHGCFVDILPRGVSKGPSLLRLIEYLKFPRARVLVAGDTLNDLSMFQTGLHGAVVGGAEPALLEATCELPLAYHCRTAGAGGILEAMRAHALFPTIPEEWA
jgi:hydroxymethylpyrimidine pyrophosphatase-like HAD family hydrolase